MYGRIPDEIKKKINALEGISFNDWQKIKGTIDSFFEKKMHDAKREFRIVPEEVDYYPY